MRQALMQWYTRPGTQSVQHADGTLEPPGQITIGYYTPHGFAPARAWIAALEIDSVRDRIMDDMLSLYGPGGEFERRPENRSHDDQDNANVSASMRPGGASK